MQTKRDIEPLSTHEANRLSELEIVITAGLQQFYAVGSALAEINVQRLYRARFDTFEEYCHETWGLKRSRAYQLMKAAEVVEPLALEYRPAREAHAIALAGVPNEWKEAVVQLVDEVTEGRPTASAIRSLAAVAKGIIDTGAIDPGTGEQVPWRELDGNQKRALLMTNMQEETWERYQRHKASAKPSKCRELLEEAQKLISMLYQWVLVSNAPAEIEQQARQLVREFTEKSGK